HGVKQQTHALHPQQKAGVAQPHQQVVGRKKGLGAGHYVGHPGIALLFLFLRVGRELPLNDGAKRWLVQRLTVAKLLADELVARVARADSAERFVAAVVGRGRHKGRVGGWPGFGRKVAIVLPLPAKVLEPGQGASGLCGLRATQRRDAERDIFGLYCRFHFLHVLYHRADVWGNERLWLLHQVRPFGLGQAAEHGPHRAGYRHGSQFLSGKLSSQSHHFLRRRYSF
nr:hypothetical protein [Tanacetum cinerariifolium]